MYEIKHLTGKVIYRSEAANTVKEAAEEASRHGSALSYSDLSGSDLSYSKLRGSDLRGSDLRGSNLSCSNLRGSDLRDSDLRDSDLSDSDLRYSDLSGSDLSGSDLSYSDLRGSNLSGSDLRGSNLSDSDLSGSNLRGVVGLPDAVSVPSLHRRILDAIDNGGTLNMVSWHTCATTHCRAGWAVSLAGPAGEELESRLGPSLAGALIHLASCPQLDGQVPDFLASDEDAMEDIKRLAALEPELV